MIAAVVLVLVFMLPGNRFKRVGAYPMPTQEACWAAAGAFLQAQPPRSLGEEPTEFRSAACVVVEAQGRPA